MTVIVVTGVPGTGKTTVARALAKKFKLKYIDIKKVIKDKALSEGFDKERNCDIVDEKQLAKVLEGMIKENVSKGMVIDGHLSHYLKPKFVDVCVVTKCDLKVLKERLVKRKYSQKKVEENMEAAIFDICYEEAKQLKHTVKIVDTTKEFSGKDLSGLVEEKNH